MAYQETLRNTELIVQEERSRKLRVRIVMLENDNDDLNETIAAGDDRIELLEQDGDELRAQLEQARQELLHHEANLRSQARELSNVKVGLHSAT